MSKHTPGEWEVVAATPTTVKTKSGRISVNWSATNDGGARNAEAEANALLIAAAPDMLHALREMLANCDRWLETGIPANAEESKRLYDQMTAAVKKAMGGEG